MPLFDFDTIIERKGSSCVKFDRLNEIFGREDLLPMWVADMDFKSPPSVIEAVEKLAQHGVLGYSFRPESAVEAFSDWVKNHYGWSVQREWISSSPGIVTAIALCVRLYTQKGDKVLIQTPVYPPFRSIVKKSGRELITNSLVKGEDRYTIDFEDFEEKIKSGVKLFILCNSHNPVGRVWEREELRRMAELCIKYGVMVFSDEIHADLALFGNVHTPFASISDEAASISITAMAPSKTFNIAGALNSVMVIPDSEKREIFNEEIESLHLDLGNIIGHATMEAAYRGGNEWLTALKSYLENNISYACDYINNNIPGVSVLRPEGSFLLWLDFSKSGYTHEEISHMLINKAKIALNDGLAFGEEGRNYFRMNVGTPLSITKEGLRRVREIFI